MSTSEPQVYLDGYRPLSEACISPDDRGFLFGDGVYESVAVYAGTPFLLGRHVERLERSLAELEIRSPDDGRIVEVAERLLVLNDLDGADATIYMQVTRGAAPRRHAFPDLSVAPTLYARVQPWERLSSPRVATGVAAITIDDHRWDRCDIKTTSLVANVLASQRAAEAGVFESLFVRDGVVLEGSHSNLFTVDDGVVSTHPTGHEILAGVTRGLTIELGRESGIEVRERARRLDEVLAADEAFLTGTTTEIVPLVEIDGVVIGDGEPGERTLELRRRFEKRVGEIH